VSIDIMDIGKVFDVGRVAVSNGCNDAELERVIRTFVQTIRRD